MSIHCEIIPFDSDGYRETVAIRNQLLREPLGLTFTDDERADEPLSFHLAAREEQRLVACVVLTPLERPGLVRLRQFAVIPERQGMGVGSMLCLFAEDFVRERGFERITMHARLAASGFYAHLAYQRVGDVFTEVGIAHVTMEKSL